MESTEIPYEILDYQKYNERINRMMIQNEGVNVYPIVKEETSAYTDCGFPIEKFHIGNGEKHILVMGGTHGCEVITVDFVTQLMDRLAKGEFPNFDPNEFTIDFVPLHNPEGFIIATSAANFKLAGKNDEEIEKFCKEYYLAYRQDDINSKNNPNDRSLKLHHKLFEGITVDCIPSIDARYDKLKDKVRDMLDRKMGGYSIPAEAMIDWRANGNGIELNGNNPHTYRSELKKLSENDGIGFGTQRFSNIPKLIPGPLGVSTLDMEKFKYENENIFLFQHLANLNKNKQNYATFTYHGTGGLIFYRPYDLKQNESEKTRMYKDEHNIPEVYNYNDIINEKIAQSYHYQTDYRYIKTPHDMSGVGDVLRSVYPGFLLVELSRMGGNPIAPYGDRYGNYENTIKTNMRAFDSSLAMIREMDYLYWETFEVSRDEVNKRRGR